MWFFLLLACADKVAPIDSAPLDDSAPPERVDLDADGFPEDEDCDDADPAVFPGAEERCDGVDQDCDAAVDEDAADAPSWHPDGDGDGFGDPAAAVVACEAPSGLIAEAGDCDDADPAVFPGAEERCDERDEDCDAAVDEDAVDAVLLHVDADSDGYGDPDRAELACVGAPNRVDDDQDCEDSDATAYPGSTAYELPFDGVDQDCDGDDVCEDLDCDGLPDLLVAEHTGPGGHEAARAMLYFGAGDFRETDRHELSVTGVRAVSVADLNGDGWPDLIFGDHVDDSGAHELGLRLCYGGLSGYSDAGCEALPAYAPLEVLTPDLDGDGWLDLVVVNGDAEGASPPVQVYRGSPSGLGAAEELAADGAVTAIAEDLDGDGWLDLAVCHGGVASVETDSQLWYGAASGFAAGPLFPTQGCADVAAVDVDADGWLDLIFANQVDAAGAYEVDSLAYPGGPDGFTAEPWRLPTVGASAVVAQDLDGDAWAELAFGSYRRESWGEAGEVRVYRGSADGPDLSTVTALSATGLRQLVAADLDGDGLPELIGPVWFDGGSSDAMSLVWRSDAREGYSDSRVTELPTQGANAVTVGDLDGDGYPELTFANERSDQGRSAYTTAFFGAEAGYDFNSRLSFTTTSVVAPVVIVGD